MPRPALACFVALSMVATLAAPRPSAAQDHRLWVGLDLDLDDSTGCLLEGADDSGDQTASGFEWVAKISITPSGTYADVVDVEKQACDDAETRNEIAWESQGSTTTASWAVGVDLGEDPDGDVVELEIDTTDLGVGDEVRLAVLSESADGHRDTLFTLDGSSAGASIIFPTIEAAPALSNGALGVLVLFFLASALLAVRRSPWTLALWIFAFGLSAERAIASITLVEDGLIGDWGSLVALASDPAEDSEQSDPSADILALFVDWSGSNLAVRVDVADLVTEVCQHPHATSPCYYVSEDGDDSNDGRSEASQWETLSTALTNLEDGARLIIAAGDYEVAGKIDIDYERVQILGEDGVRIHNTIEDFTEIDGWTDLGDDIYVSVESQGTAEDLANANLSGRFTVGDEAFMLMPYQCSEVFETDNHFYDSGDNEIDCDEAPYIGPGLYLDVDGSYADELETEADDAENEDLEAILAAIGEGHLFLRMDTSPEPLNSIVASEGWTTPIDPNQTVMEITLNGPRLQLEGDNIVVSNLKLELGSLRMGGGHSENELRDIELDGPTYDAPIEIYSGGSETILDGITIDQNFAPWITWQDTKKIFLSSIRFSAISFNARGDADEAIHDIVLRNSTIRNVHDGLEVNLDAYHHISISNNTFTNVQDDAIQLGSSPYEIEIAGNRMVEVGTGVSRHGTGSNAFPGYKYIHHNYIDSSTAKYYCRETSAGVYGSSCDGNGMLTMRGFQVHLGDGWGPDGDGRYIYNNTVIVDGQMVGVGFQGQQYPFYCTDGGFPGDTTDRVLCDYNVANDCDNYCVEGNQATLATRCSADSDCETSLGLGDGVCSSGAICNYELPYGKPSLVFNNVFVQLDETTSLVKESPKWSILAPPVLILGGNLYYQPDPAASIFDMSSDTCGLDGFQADHCKGGGTWTPQISEVWEAYDSPGITVDFSWGLEEGGLEDGLELGPGTDYVPDCDWLSAQVDGFGDVIEPIDLTAIDGAYSVAVTGVSPDPWTLSLTKPLPGVDPGDPYRGVTPCVDE